MDNASNLEFSWIERDGPTVHAPASTDFGTWLLRRGIDDATGADIASAPEKLRDVASPRIVARSSNVLPVP